MESVEVSPVETARLVVGSREVCDSDRVDKPELELGLGGANPVGERKKSRDHVLGVVPGFITEPFLSKSRVLVCCRVAFTLGGTVSIEESRGIMDASGRLMSSLNSFTVNAASSGPRRPIIETCFTVLFRNTSNTGSGTSYFSSALGEESSIRAMSRETFPFPINEMCVILSKAGGGGREGCWVYQ